MAIPSIPAVGISPSPLQSIARPAATQAADAANAGRTAGTSFGDAITNALDALVESHAEADHLALQAATGDLNAVHDYTIAATEAQLLTQLTVEVRNRAIEAFNDIMRMQV